MPSLNMTFVKRTKQWKTIFSCPICWIESYYFKKTIGTLSYSNLKLKNSNRMSFTEKSQVYKYLQNMQVASLVEETKKLSVNFLFSLFRGWNERTAIWSSHLNVCPMISVLKKKGKVFQEYPSIKSRLKFLSPQAKTTLVSFCNSVSGIERPPQSNYPSFIAQPPLLKYQ